MSITGTRKWITVLTVSIFLIVGLVVWTAHRSDSAPVLVQTTLPAYRDVANMVTTNGVVQPVAEFQARANFPGIVEKIQVELGDKVAPGQMLVAMKDPFAVSRVANATSAVSAASATDQDIRHGGTQEERIAFAGDLAHAKQTQEEAAHGLDVLEQLHKQGAAGAGEVQTARERLQNADVTLQTLEQRSRERFSPMAQQAVHDRLADSHAALDAAKVTFDNANIRSSISGTVYAISVSPYDFVGMGADLLRVADLTRMQIRAYFDEPEVGKLKEGQDVTVTWDGRPGLIWHGHIRKAPVAAMPQGGRSVAECVIKIDDSHGDLLPNTHVMVTVPIERHPHVLTIPRLALQTNGADRVVFRVVGDRLILTPVRVGLVNLDFVEIVGGLSPQDMVAVTAANGLPMADNLVVKPVDQVHPRGEEQVRIEGRPSQRERLDKDEF